MAYCGSFFSYSRMIEKNIHRLWDTNERRVEKMENRTTHSWFMLYTKPIPFPGIPFSSKNHRSGHTVGQTKDKDHLCIQALHCSHALSTCTIALLVLCSPTFPDRLMLYLNIDIPCLVCSSYLRNALKALLPASINSSWYIQNGRRQTPVSQYKVS